MLTQEQLQKLESLTKHTKYGFILRGAIRSWKKCRPAKNAYGISLKHYKTNTITRSKNYKGCCLLGAFFLGKKNSKIIKILDNVDILLPENEYNGLIRGFDGHENKNYSLDAYEFGKKVNQIVNPVSNID